MRAGQAEEKAGKRAGAPGAEKARSQACNGRPFPRGEEKARGNAAQEAPPEQTLGDGRRGGMSRGVLVHIEI